MKPSATIRNIKIAMIPLLLVVLYCVLPSTKVDSCPGEVVGKNTAPSVPVAKIADSLSNPGVTPMITKGEWPVYQWSDVADVDPFDRRVIIPEDELEKRSDNSIDTERQLLVNSKVLQTSRLEKITIQAVFQSPRGIAALVGERTVHIGDRLDDGALVVGISPEWIVVELSSIE